MIFQEFREFHVNFILLRHDSHFWNMSQRLQWICFYGSSFLPVKHSLYHWFLLSSKHFLNYVCPLAIETRVLWSVIKDWHIWIRCIIHPLMDLERESTMDSNENGGRKLWTLCCKSKLQGVNFLSEQLVNPKCKWTETRIQGNSLQFAQDQYLFVFFWFERVLIRGPHPSPQMDEKDKKSPLLLFSYLKNMCKLRQHNVTKRENKSIGWKKTCWRRITRHESDEIGKKLKWVRGKEWNWDDLNWLGTETGTKLLTDEKKLKTENVQERKRKSK